MIPSNILKAAYVVAFTFAGAAQAQPQGQGTSLSYGGYNVGYMSVSRSGLKDASGIAFSGSFKLSESLFAAGQIAALSGLNRGRVGLGYRYPLANGTDLFVIGSLARNTGFAKDWGNAVGVGLNTLIAPGLQAQLVSTKTTLQNSASEQETAVSLSYTLTQGISLRARAMTANNTKGYEISIGSSF